jgi:hypothetical protein
VVDGRLVDGSVTTHGDADIESPADAASDAPPDAPPPPPPPPPRPASLTYPVGQRHSPIDATIAARLQSIVAGNARVFGKVGDSITVDAEFFTCFAGSSIDFAGRTDLADTHSYFASGNAGGSSPFSRASFAAIRGVTTQGILTGSPSPLSREIAAIDPQFAVIMLGTNDIRLGRTYDAFGADLWTIVDQTIASGAIPILSTMPPNNADSAADARVPKANAIVRAIAQGSPSAQSCVAGGDHQATATLAAGTVYIVVDAPDAASAGEFVLVVQAR